ncbi:MAG: hypothetical protein J5I81_06330 [Nitrococcus mobilis]|nr:hypothetical protein [Nitrococcus mobilis]
MSTLLSTLRERGVEVWAEHGQVRYRAPADVMTQELMERMRQEKDELLHLLVPVEPTDPHHCGSGAYHQTERDGPWLCSACHPRTTTPAATLTVPGGRIPATRRKDVGIVIRNAVAGLPITADEFRAWCAQDDIDDIANGLIPASTVRAYATELVRDKPKTRTVGSTVFGVQVGVPNDR